MIITEGKISEFAQFLLEEEKSEITIKKYIRDVRKFADFADRKELSKTLTVEYKATLTEKFKPSSVNSMLAAVNKFMDFLNLPRFKVKPLKIQRMLFLSEERELKREEYYRLVDAARDSGNERLMLIIEAVASTGIRISELKFITVEAVETRRADINCKGKRRVVLLTKKLCRVLKKYAKNKNIRSGAVFVTSSGKAVDSSNIRKEMKKLSESARVERQKIFPHNLRHFFARTFYSQTKDIVRLADILGHSSVDTTRIYTMESGSAHRRQLEKMELVKYD
ncbi:MAG: tyrosine-type recombinase/integrase [Ruminococcaceae bacterium]|nr:tyrosine-type recombinase/integrase [Oscillospiraceae bacterium]